VQTAECHNLNIALSETRNHAVRQETDYNSKIKTDERSINVDKESTRTLIMSNHDLTKNYDDMMLQKESQHNQIKEVRSSILDLERRIRDTHESFITKDVNHILALTDQHTHSRNDHMSSVRETIEQLRDNLHRVSSLEDMKTIEENLG
jgi:Tfp pilus assembly protein FimT